MANFKKVMSLVCIVALLVSSIAVSIPISAASEGGDALKVSVNSTPSWEHYFQNTAIEKNASYQASFWMKGKGKITLKILKDDWSKTYAEQSFTATDAWTKCVIPAIETGDNSYLTFAFMDGGDVAGSLRIDNCFLGMPGGENTLKNPGFEEGTNQWGDENAVYGISKGDGQVLASKDGAIEALDINGLIDDMTGPEKMFKHSTQYGFDTSNPQVFAGDSGRFSRGEAKFNEEVYAIYKTDYDIESFSADVYYWVDYKDNRDIKVLVSKDGASYTPVTLDRYDAGGNWKKVVYGTYDIPVVNARYIKVVFPSYLESEYAWAVQIAKLAINLSTAPVVASPDTGRLDKASEITLTTATEGADIYYFTSFDPTVIKYTQPIPVSEHVKIYAYAKKSGKEKSFTKIFTYYTPEQILVDTYGQIKKAELDGKVTADQQLIADVTSDKGYYNGFTPPERDQYGGLPGSKEKYHLEAKGFFNIQKLDGKFVMVDPIGNLYFSLGTNGTGYVGDTYTLVAGREYIYEWIPDDEGKYAAAFLNGNPDYYSHYVANKIKKDGAFDRTDNYKEAVYRLRQWGFTGEGNWPTRPLDPKDNDTQFPQVEIIDLPEGNRIGDTGLYDIFNPEAEKAIANALKEQHVADRKDDPLLIGYFFGNELQYQRFKGAVPSLKTSASNAKGALVDMLESKYKTIGALNTAWETTFKSFAEADEGALPVRTEEASVDMQNFFKQYLNRLYATISTQFRKVDPNHMLLGDRLLTNTANDTDVRTALCEVAGKYLDVISYNYYTYDLDLDRLKSMSELAGKPIMLTEFHYGEPTHGLTGGVRMMDNESEKGKAYRNYVEKAAASGVVVGTHWFEYLDQSPTGRWFQGFEGESYGIGLLDVADRPHKEMLESVVEANYNIYDILLGEKQPYTYAFGENQTERNSSNVAEIEKTTMPIVIDGVQDAAWPGDTITLNGKDRVLGIQQENVSADFRLAWDDKNLYIFTHISDPTPGENAYEGFDIWNGDAIELFVGPQYPNSPGALKVSDTQIIIAATGVYFWYNNRDPQPAMATAAKLDADGKGYSLEAAIPLSALNIQDITDGREFRFDIGFDDGKGTSRIGQYLWNGIDGNAQSRDKWGKAILVDHTAAARMTRGAFIAALIKELNLLDKTAESKFSDIKKSDWYYSAVASAQKAGLTVGCGNNKFKPETVITRQEAAVILSRALVSLKGKALPDNPMDSLTRYSDHSSISDYARKGVALLVENGLIEQTDTFTPLKSISRNEAEKYLEKLMLIK